LSKGKQGVPARYFFDTEFNEKVETPFGVDFISIAVVAQDGQREYYGVNRDFNRAAAAENAWVQRHVVDKLPPEEEWQDIEQIKAGIIAMVEPALEVEFWAKNGSYDVFILCRLFGGMNGLRDELYKAKGIEKVIFRDSNDLRRALNHPPLPEQPEDEKHDALADARQERREFLAMESMCRGMKNGPRP
jgi:hypothetical protein